jgi:hypothetical protein
MPFDAGGPEPPITNLHRLRDFLAEVPANQFDMRHWWLSNDDTLFPREKGRHHPCGTIGCIGGWTNFLATAKDEHVIHAEDRAEEWLGLNERTANALFYPHVDGDNHRMRWGQITPTMAVKVIDHLIATGRVDWDVAFEPVKERTNAV